MPISLSNFTLTPLNRSSISTAVLLLQEKLFMPGGLPFTHDIFGSRLIKRNWKQLHTENTQNKPVVTLVDSSALSLSYHSQELLLYITLRMELILHTILLNTHESPSTRDVDLRSYINPQKQLNKSKQNQIKMHRSCCTVRTTFVCC